MSLSFVASAVQTGTSDGGYEETPIESKIVEAVNRQNATKPLFEQLRQQQEEEQERQEEMQREIMRGTCTLNEEDVAHLDSLRQQREEKERVIRERTQEEVAAFRAARAEKQQEQLDQEQELKEATSKTAEEYNNNDSQDHETKPTNKPRIVPKIVVKRKRRQPESETEASTSALQNERNVVEERSSSNDPKKPKVSTEEATSGETKVGLGGLLSGYGSSDDDSDDN